MHGSERKLVIPGITEVTVKGIAGRGGKDVVWFENVGHPYSEPARRCEGRRQQLTRITRSIFNNSGRNGHFSGIDWTSG